MGQSSSQVQPSQAEQKQRNASQTPSTTGSHALARELENSVMKASQQYTKRLSASSPEILSSENDPLQIRPFKRQRVAERAEFVKPTPKASEKSTTTVRPFKSPAVKGTQRKSSQLKQQVKSADVAAPQPTSRTAVNDSVDEWLSSGTPAPPEVVPLLETRQAEGSELRAPRVRPQEEATMTTRRRLARDKSPQVIVQKRKRADGEDENAAQEPSTPQPGDGGLEASEARPRREATRVANRQPSSSFISTQALKRKRGNGDDGIVAQGPPKTPHEGNGLKAFKVRTEADVASTITRAPDGRFQPRRKQGRADGDNLDPTNWPSKGEFLLEEVLIAERVFEETRRKAGLTDAQMREEIQNWGRNADDWPFKTAVREALPNRETRSLRKFCLRYFKPKSRASFSKANHISDQQDHDVDPEPAADSAVGVDEQTHISDPVDVSMNDVAERIDAVSEREPASSDEVMEDANVDDLGEPVEIAPTQETAQTFTSATAPDVASTNLTVMSQSDEDSQPSQSSQGKGPTATQHLNIFDTGDYFDILYDTLAALRKDPRIAELVHKDSHDSCQGHLDFWRAVCKRVPQSKFGRVGNHEIEARLRRRAYVTMLDMVANLGSDTKEFLRDGRSPVRQKVNVILKWMVENENTRPKNFRRLWREDLTDCTRLECALIRWSEALEHAQYWNHSFDDHNGDIDLARKLGRIRLDRARELLLQHTPPEILSTQEQAVRSAESHTAGVTQRQQSTRQDPTESGESQDATGAVIPDSQPGEGNVQGQQSHSPIKSKSRPLVKGYVLLDGKATATRKSQSEANGLPSQEIPETQDRAPRNSETMIGRLLGLADDDDVLITSHQPQSSYDGLPASTAGNGATAGAKKSKGRKSHAGLGKDEFLARCRDVSQT